MWKLQNNLWIVCFGSHDVGKLVDTIAPKSQYRQNCQAEHLNHLYPLTPVTDRHSVTNGAWKKRIRLRHKKNLTTRLVNVLRVRLFRFPHYRYFIAFLEILVIFLNSLFRISRYLPFNVTRPVTKAVSRYKRKTMPKALKAEV